MATGNENKTWTTWEFSQRFDGRVDLVEHTHSGNIGLIRDYVGIYDTITIAALAAAGIAERKAADNGR